MKMLYKRHTPILGGKAFLYYCMLLFFIHLKFMVLLCIFIFAYICIDPPSVVSENCYKHSSLALVTMRKRTIEDDNLLRLITCAYGVIMSHNKNSFGIRNQWRVY